ncbi:hypothetical protein TA05_13830 [Citrobacter rodentium]|nr:hypothetical protein TA05_13830 [Citrobacter rodentium]
MQMIGNMRLPVFKLKIIFFRYKDVGSLHNLIIMNERTVQNIISSKKLCCTIWPPTDIVFRRIAITYL